MKPFNEAVERQRYHNSPNQPLLDVDHTIRYRLIMNQSDGVVATDEDGYPLVGYSRLINRSSCLDDNGVV